MAALKGRPKAKQTPKTKRPEFKALDVTADPGTYRIDHLVTKNSEFKNLDASKLFVKCQQFRQLVSLDAEAANHANSSRPHILRELARTEATLESLSSISQLSRLAADNVDKLYASPGFLIRLDAQPQAPPYLSQTLRATSAAIDDFLARNKLAEYRHRRSTPDSFTHMFIWCLSYDFLLKAFTPVTAENYSDFAHLAAAAWEDLGLPRTYGGDSYHSRYGWLKDRIKTQLRFK